MAQVNLYEAKTHLSTLVDRAAAGEEIVIAKNGKALAKLVAVEKPRKPREPARVIHVTSVADDFDEVDPEIVEMFERRDLMELLLDTRVVLWWNEGAARLRPDVRDKIRDLESTIYVSAATPWEIAVKTRKGRMAFRGPLERLIQDSGFVPRPIDPGHGVTAGSLDWDHGDPFDRVLVAQAQMEALVLVHADRAIREFGKVSQLWAA